MPSEQVFNNEWLHALYKLTPIVVKIFININFEIDKTLYADKNILYVFRNVDYVNVSDKFVETVTVVVKVLCLDHRKCIVTIVERMAFMKYNIGNNYCSCFSNRYMDIFPGSKIKSCLQSSNILLLAVLFVCICVKILNIIMHNLKMSHILTFCSHFWPLSNYFQYN